jgi:hypothetical protein
MTASTETASSSDNSFPYALVYSTFGTILSLASVWIVSAQSYAAGLVA